MRILTPNTPTPEPQCWTSSHSLQHIHCCPAAQAFAIVLKGKVRPGRSRADPADGSRCAYDTRAKLGAVLGPQAAAYVLGTRNPPGAVARALSRCLSKAAQSADASLPLFAAQRCEEIIRGARRLSFVSMCPYVRSLRRRQ